MKKKILLLTACFAALTSSINAAGPCNPCCDDLEYSIYADYLYWNVGTDFTSISVGTVESITRNFNPDYNSGYRIGGNIRSNCWDLGLRYTDFNTKQKKNFFELIQNSYDLDYQIVDLDLGYIYGSCCKNTYLRPFIGAKFAWIDEKRSTLNLGSGGLSNSDIKMCGYGLSFGAEGHWSFLECGCFPLALYFRGDFAIINATIDRSHQRLEAGAITADDLFNDLHSYQTGHEIAVGLEIGYTGFCCVNPSLMIGYEIQGWDWWKDTVSDQATQSLGLGGLVARLKLNF
ncbi:MAG: hypothetical protein S4CHLAM123_08250 [Chlamydiales bacterium]|nr:hypothetical protein [Chlamydiales bacterium]